MANFSIMRDSIRKLYEILSSSERRQVVGLLGLLLVVAVFEMLGVASIIPFIAVLSRPETVLSQPYLSRAYDFLGFASLDQFLFWMGIGVLVMLLMSLLFRSAGYWAQLKFTQSRNHSLASRMVDGYLQQPYEFFITRHSAETGNSILAEVGHVINDALFPAVQICANAFVAIALMTLLVFVDPILALFIAGGLGGAYALIYVFVKNKLTKIGEARKLHNRERFKAVQEAFGGIKDVKISGLEQVLLQRFVRPSSKMVHLNTARGLMSQLPGFAMQGVIYGGMMLIILYLLSTHNNIQEALPIIAVYAFAGYRLMPTLQRLYAQFTLFRTATPMLNSLHHDLVNLELFETETVKAKPLKVERSIEFKDVSFSYPNTSQLALDRLSINIPVNSTIGIVGSSGSGKTTAVDLMLGLLVPNKGSLAVDGVDIGKHNLRNWQRSLGYVPQNMFLTDASIAENIAFGLPADEIDMDAVERASKTANLHEFVTTQLEKGYETEVGERGIRLSGGQRQRIGIARALYHDPQVIIMDEATSALDNLTERAVMEAVYNLSRQKTIILIAHRLSTVKTCDEIFLMEQGTLVAAGRFDELVKQNAQFRAMAVGED